MATESEPTITCACGAPMVERVNRLNLSTFMGCSTWPACEQTQKAPAYLEVKRAGGIELPGFGTEG